jgi:RNA polymerase sigma factor (sigma-70 family)
VRPRAQTRRFEAPTAARAAVCSQALMPDDQELLEAWRRGDEDAGEALFERCYEGLARFFRSKAGDGAADLIQRTFLILLETRSRMREGTSFHCYLYGIARNVLYEHYRGKRRDGERFQPDQNSVEDLGPTPTTLMAQAQETRLLLQALRRIPLESQMILELYYWEQMTAKDVADVLEVPEGTARTRIRRAKQLLEAQLTALADTPQLLQSTVSDLDSWAQHLRAALKSR